QLLGRVPLLRRRSVLTHDTEEEGFARGAPREHPRGDGVLSGDSRGAAAWVPRSREEGEALGETPPDDVAPRQGLPVEASETEAMEVVQDAALPDERPVEGWEGLGKLRENTGLDTWSVVGGAFTSEVPFAGHQIPLDTTQLVRYIRLHHRVTKWSFRRRQRA